MGTEGNYERLFPGQDDCWYVQRDSGVIELAFCPGQTTGFCPLPIYSNPTPSNAVSGATEDVTLQGFYLDTVSAVTIGDHTVNSITPISPTEMTVNVTWDGTVGLADLTLDATCGQVVVSDAFDAFVSVWLDLSVPADYVTANPVVIGGASVSQTANGAAITGTGGWNSIVRFDGSCAGVSSNFEMVVFRQGTAARAMIGLTSDTTAPTATWPGNNSYQRQYIGFWNSGTGGTSYYGSQAGEGGTNWNQNSGSNVATPAGSYRLYRYESAGQGGATVEVWDSDASFNKITLLNTFTSNKPTTPATTVCHSVVPLDAVASDYFVRGLRIL